MRVIIVGGGIAGLTLANALQHAGIDFVLLEGRSVIDPQVGASIGILPNGGRILDQLGCYEAIYERTSPTKWGRPQHADGSILGGIMDTPKLLAARHGYWVCFLDRQDALRVLADHVKDQSKIYLNKRVSSVDSGSHAATVHCTDGTSYQGYLVIGADGVNSIVRKEMWRLADIDGLGRQFEKDKTAMFAEYKCYFGISNPVKGLEVGENIVTYDRDRSYLSITSKGGRIYWFAFAKMDRRYEGHEIPKFDKADHDKFMEEYADLPVFEDKIKLRDLDAAKVSGTLVALEEAKYDHWSYGRLACMGDAIHKMTPNLGAGGNSAIESVGVLANLLHRLGNQNDAPSLLEIRTVLEQYQSQRSVRTNKIMEMANDLTRLQALKGKKEYFISHYVLPNSGDFMAEVYAEFMVGSPLLEYLPPPERSLEATLPFNSEQGWGHEENKAVRAKSAIPLLLLALACYFWNSRTHASEGHHAAGMGAMREAIDYCTLYGIWLIESSRRNNRLTFSQLPIIFGLASRNVSTGVAASVYWFLHYVSSPIEKFKAADHRLTNLGYTSTVLPAVLLLHLLPVYLTTDTTDQQDQQWWAWIPSLSCLWIAVAQSLLARFVMPDTIGNDARDQPRRDAAVIRFTGVVLAMLSTVSTWTTYTFENHMTDEAWYNTAFASTAGLMWLLYAFGDLKRAGMMDQS